ncbi:putative pentatricopeptide repeat-containing protein At3g25060, mitochondrial [Neltuma alba]|uniref:putative pentatricopeptide repeat-containing protein At3g25060, mitochondrial n=1 Tax=Neltuma alba TaxID=207710 RepID=UPI0010A581C5|nr:putative pentatricopeptide repeat-containing protein At3g25060, mitochondrial [Prosopis alba]
MRLLHPWTNHFKLLLLACQEKASIAKLHALIILAGTFTQNNIGGQLIASYVRIGDITSARQVFNQMSQRGINAWNAMIVSYSREGYQDEVLNLYHRMILEGVKPDSSIFTVALKACTRLLDLKIGKEIWSEAVDCGYGNDVFVECSALNMYAKCGKMDEAMELFKKMPRKDLVCWTTMISGFAQCGRAMEALDVYRKMQNEGMDGDGVVMLGLVQAIANLGDSRLGLSVHGYLIRQDIPMDVVIQTSLVDMYAKTGHLGLAFQVFSMMPNKNIISWAALISGLAQNGFAGNTLELLVEMQGLGFKPDSVCLVSALLACSQFGCLKLGKSIHGYIIKRLDFERVSGTAVIDMYSKCGSHSSASALFDQIRFKDVVSWNAMISTYGIHGNGKEALSLFQKMIELNTEPNHATFTALFSALSHSGLVQEGRYWFDLMINKFKITADEKHYACMIDLLARAGQVEEALKLIDSMKIEPAVAVWVALLGGCYKYDKFFIGEKVAKKVLELNPDDPGIYTLVSNFFAKARKWDEVAEVKKIMNMSGVKKVPGYSVVEVNGKQDAFLMEDRSHHLYKDIVCMLDNLDLEMRVAGYVTFDEFLLFDLQRGYK